MTTGSGSPASADVSRGTLSRNVLAPALVVAAIALGIALICCNVRSVLLLFAGVLVAAFLDACTRGLARIAPLERTWRLSLVVTILGAVIALVAAWGIVRIPEQARVVIRVMDTQIDILQNYLTGFGIDLFGPEGARDFSRVFPEPGLLFGHLRLAFGTASGILVNTIVVVCLGLFFAANPAAYREGALRLVPMEARGRVREVMDEMGAVLRNWLLGQLIRIALVAVVMSVALHLLGLPGAFLLGFQAGLANFIPYLGPLLAGVPVALVAMPLGVSFLAWAMGLYIVIQTIEGFVLGPMIHREAVDLPPAWTLVAIVVGGAMFGAMGVALATPLLAVGRVAVLRFYVEDWLGDRRHPATAGPS